MSDLSEYTEAWDRCTDKIIAYVTGKTEKVPHLDEYFLPHYLNQALQRSGGSFSANDIYHGYFQRLRAKDEEAWALLFEKILSSNWVEKYIHKLRPYSPWPNAIFARADMNCDGTVGKVVTEDLAWLINKFNLKGTPNDDRGAKPGLLILPSLPENLVHLVAPRPIT